MSDMHPIRCEGVHQRFGRNAVLRGATLAVPEGATTVLLGANGEGKSTLLRVLLGALRPQEGSAEILGLDPIKQSRAVKAKVGYVPDKPDVYGWMKVKELFRFLAPYYATWDPAHAKDLAAQLDVPLDTKFKHLSRGQGMKAMLTAALAHRPPVLLLDEPFGGLDPLIREQVLVGMIDAMGAEPRTVLLTTHDLDIAARMADRVAFLGKGRIEREGPADEIVQGGDGATPAKLREALADVAEQEPAVGEAV